MSVAINGGLGAFGSGDDSPTDGDTGAGVGASHQTGWTALVVSLIYEYWNKYERT